MKFTRKILTPSNQSVSIQPSTNQFSPAQATVPTANHKQLPFKPINKPCKTIKIHSKLMTKPNNPINWLFKPITVHIQRKCHKYRQHRRTHIKAIHPLVVTTGARILDKIDFLSHHICSNLK